MAKRNIIVIGASAGGFEAIKKIVSGFPANFDASVFIVWHMSSDVRGILPQVLSKVGKLPASNAIDREPVKAGRIYIAPPDYHLVLEKELVRITKGPKENRFRPAIDPLFRSAAYVYSNRVIGIILSGALDDGTAGLWAIKQRGGIAMVQDPEEAEVQSMPENAIKAVKVDYILPADEIGETLLKISSEDVEDLKLTDMEQEENLKKEIEVSLEDEALKMKLFETGELTPYTCPECHGVLSAIREGRRVRYRCHTGHAFTADSLLSSISENIETSFWNAIRNVQESVFLLNHMGDHFAEMNEPNVAAGFFKKAKESLQRAEFIRKVLTEHEQLNIETIEEQTEKKKPME